MAGALVEEISGGVFCCSLFVWVLLQFLLAGKTKKKEKSEEKVGTRGREVACALRGGKKRTNCGLQLVLNAILFYLYWLRMKMKWGLRC